MYFLKYFVENYVRSQCDGKVEVINENQLKNGSFDAHGTLFVDYRIYMLCRLYLHDVYTVNFQSQHTSTTRSLRLYPVKCRQTTFYITSTVQFNIFKTNQTLDIRVTNIRADTNDIKVLEQVHLSPVKQLMPNIDNSILDYGLVSYFGGSRLLYNSDLIGVNVSFGNKMVTVYYKVLHQKEYFFVNSTTRLLQSATASARRPLNNNIDTSFTPTSIKTTVTELVSIFEIVFLKEKAARVTVNTLVSNDNCSQDVVLKMAANVLGVNLATFNCYDLWNTEGKPTDTVVNGWFEKVKQLEPCVVRLQNMHILAGNKNVDLDSGNRILEVLTQTLQNLVANAVVFIPCTSTDLESLPKSFTKLIHFKFVVNDLKSHDRQEFTEYLVQQNAEFDREKILESVRGMTLTELNQLVEEANLSALKENRSNINQEDLNWALELRNKAFGEAVGVPKVPNVSWDDVGGLEDVKQLISESLKVNLDHKKSNLRRSGVVLYGPPGCGKTLIAKAVANEFKMTFLSVKGPELLNQYIGQSEKNLRQVFERAKSAAPSIVFFDELDSLAPSRGVAGDSGGVMDRMVSQLLSELDGLQTVKDSPVFVMGATNRPDLLDPCLLSPGRFDKLIEVKLATDFESKVRILNPICKKVKLHQELTVEDVARLCPETMSGAELSSVISKAAMLSVQERIEALEAGGESDLEPVRIHQTHIILALQSL
ncbi:unnamed protein product [Bursaphelenchus okinawaensis]|uniref:Peroxisomal ATPase PEX6 n=1 Tax=Bursaphelenchus okinawaensis TaxID=465554 RepID=A0A811LAE5_9BILA|nr:unnamed protein product [Bursaphelenchus okinawaensis]CAG9120070.1 unnamed protein product [Bursaphelenchus okinawaensis]